jgi:tetratricopeptide (TPR) repeat protein
LIKKAASVQDLESSVKWKMAPLYITHEHDTLKGRKIIEELMGEADTKVITLTPGEVIDGYLGIGLSYLLEKNYKNAQEVFEKVLSIDAKNNYGHINLGYTFLEMGELKKAVEVFGKNQDPYSQIGFILSNLELFKLEKNNDYFKAALDKSRELLKLNPIELRSKVFFLNSLIESIVLTTEDKAARKPEVIADYVQKTLDEVFQDSEEYVFPYLIYQEGSRWSHFASYCNEFISTVEDNPHIKALQSYCFYKADKEVEALKLLEDANKQLPNDPILQGYQAFLLNSMGKDLEAAAILKLNSNSQLKVMNYVQGQICYVKKDLVCAEAQWRKILEKDSNNQAAMSGVIQVLFDQRKLPQALEVVARGMSVSPHYRPILELKTLF